MDEPVKAIFAKLKAKNWRITTAESCTGGLVAAAITEVAGSSAFFERGFVTYANSAKTSMLGVPPQLLETHGAVSPEVAQSMARGALEQAGADIAVAVTGIAGPDGGSLQKPVGLVYIGVATWEVDSAHEHIFKGTRTDIRAQTVNAALSHVLAALE